MRTKKELIEKCTNEHDRKIMIKALEESDKRIGRSHKLLGLCFLLAVISFSLFGLGFEYGLLGLIPLPFILVILQIKMINEVGLV